MSNYWGYHLRLDVAACDIAKASSVEYIAKYNQSLLDVIKMKSMGEPWIQDCGPQDRPDLCGVTLLQPIETSSITAHFCNESGDAYLDIFSCKPFDNEAIIAHFHEWFAPARIRYDFTVRQA
jgi:S-adenosylmethionine/arginine decarboxylase-like enzyme